MAPLIAKEPTNNSFDREKFKELIVYVSEKCEKDLYWGATKLNKVLFYSDFLTFKLLGRAITRAKYIAEKEGPVPRALKPVRNEMVDHKDIALDVRTFQHRTVALRPAKLSLFTAEQIAIVDRVIEELRDKDAQETSDLSHAFLGWKAAYKQKQLTGKQVVIPYETVFVSNEPMDEFEEAHGLELAKKYGWAIR